MFDLFEANKKVRHHVIVKEKEILTMLKALDSISQESKRGCLLMNMEIGNCGWKKKPDSWYVFFTLSNKDWRSLIMLMDKLDYDLVLGTDTYVYLSKRVES